MDAIKPHLDDVIRACAADPQFRWTIESVWQLQAWLDRTHDTALIDRMAALLRSGQIELSAADGSMHTEFMGSEELNRLVYAAKGAEQRFGLRASVAMMNDVPGFSMRLPQVLARSGVGYLITGSNIAFGGGTSLTPGKMPIYWGSPDGSKVLMWQTQGKKRRLHRGDGRLLHRPRRSRSVPAYKVLSEGMGGSFESRDHAARYPQAARRICRRRIPALRCCAPLHARRHRSRI